MQTPLYLKDGVSSSKKSFNPSLLPENRLNLLPEHHAQIGTAFIQQLALASLKARDVQILSAIYNQTIGFDKREDDMNGRRLEQLTGIRSDHANDAVRRLENWNVIVTHSGHYGKWMSINFDLVNWGQIAPESQTNEPYVLLSDCYQPLLATNLNDDEQLTLHVPPVSVPKEAIVEIKTEQQPTISSPLTKEDPVQLPNKEAAVTLPSTPLPSIPLPLTPADKDSKTDAFEIHFPKSLAKEICQKIIRHLQEIKIPAQAQRLVDYFAQCLQKGTIRSPIAYFINLKNRLLNNQLELPEDPKIVEAKQEEQSTLSELRYKYQQAITDHKQLKQQIETISNENNCTFEQALESIGYTMIWQKAGAKLEAIKQSLQPYYQENFS